MVGLVLAVVLALAPAPSSSPRRDAVDLLNQAIRLEARNNTAEAEATLRRALAADSSYVRTYDVLAGILRKQGKLAEARAILEAGLGRAAKGTEEHARMSYALGVILSTLADDAAERSEQDRLRRRAVQTFDAAVASDETHHRAYYRRGRQLRALGEPKRADASFRSCIAMESRFVDCFVELGQMYVDYGYIEEGLAVLAEGSRVNPKNPRGWSGRGAALMGLQRYREAKQHYVRALKIDPDQVDVLYGLGLTSFELGEREQSIQYLRSFLERAGRDVPEALRTQAQDLLYRQQDVI